MARVLNMQSTSSLVSSFIESRRENKLALRAVFIILGVALLSLLAQVKIPLPFTPVFITGQTFGVALIALTWGALAPLTVASYLLIGFLGAPVFAQMQSGFVLGPTIGYLFGMLLASVVVGFLSERAIVKGFWSALGAAYLGSLCVFAIGLPVLAQFVGWDRVVALGLLPFIPGDFIKNVAAATIASKLVKISR
jgi:biotin transport system substrate-specific component